MVAWGQGTDDHPGKVDLYGMRLPIQVAIDDQRPGRRTQTGEAAPTSEYASTSDAPTDDWVSWTGLAVTVTKAFRFGQSGDRGFGKGGLQ